MLWLIFRYHNGYENQSSNQRSRYATNADESKDDNGGFPQVNSAIYMPGIIVAICIYNWFNIFIVFHFMFLCLNIFLKNQFEHSLPNLQIHFL